MLQLTETEVLDKIRHRIPFEAQLNDGSLIIRISEYQLYRHSHSSRSPPSR